MTNQHRSPTEQRMIDGRRRIRKAQNQLRDEIKSLDNDTQTEIKNQYYKAVEGLAELYHLLKNELYIAEVDTPELAKELAVLKTALKTLDASRFRIVL